MRASRHFLVSTTAMALLGVLSQAVPSQAIADPKTPDYAAAKQHYGDAEKAAQEKDWTRAAMEYGVAYEITRDPVLFFKLGNAYQLSGDCTRAVEYYERYLAEASPSTEYVADTSARISKCNSEAPKEEEQAVIPPLETTTPALEDVVAPATSVPSASDSESVGQPTFLDDEPTWQETAAWTSVGISFAFLSASAILGLNADSREEDISNLFRYRDAEGRPAEYSGTVQERHEMLVDEGRQLNALSLIALGLAGASTASAVLFFVLDSPGSSESDGLSSITPIVTNESMGVRADWAF